jgi:hypothetical protein
LSFDTGPFSWAVGMLSIGLDIVMDDESSYLPKLVGLPLTKSTVKVRLGPLRDRFLKAIPGKTTSARPGNC